MATDKGNRETYLPLLQDAQAYLKLLLEDKVPNSLLVVAWENFYRVYDDLIHRFVVVQGVPHSDVDDCVQEVRSEVAARLFEIGRPGLRAWLFALVRSKATKTFCGAKPDSLDQRNLAENEHCDTRADPATLYEQQVGTGRPANRPRRNLRGNLGNERPHFADAADRPPQCAGGCLRAEPGATAGPRPAASDDEKASSPRDAVYGRPHRLVKAVSEKAR